MARVNVEDRFFGERRLEKFAKFMGWTKREAVGCLVMLWHESQESVVKYATADDIVDWCCEDESEAEKVVGQLVRWKYVSQIPSGKKNEGLFLIHGNEEQIKSRMVYQKRAIKGGKATREKWNRINLENDSEKGRASSHASSLPPSRLEASSKQAQCKAMQGNARQGNAKQVTISCGGVEAPPLGLKFDSDLSGHETKPDKKIKKVAAKVVTDSSLVWMAYAGAYKIRYGVEPARNAKVNGQIAQLIQRIPKEDCPNLVKYFVAHHDQFYLKKGHDIGLCLQDSQSLYTQMRRGKMVTTTTARDSERSEGNMSVMNEFLQERRSGRV